MFCTTKCWDCEDYECKYEMQIKETNKLQQRMDKAIKYVEESFTKPVSLNSYILLEILNGSDKE